MNIYVAEMIKTKQAEWESDNVLKFLYECEVFI